MIVNGNTRIVDATFEDLARYLQDRGFVQGSGDKDEPIRGYSGLAQFLNLSYNTAKKYCNEGLFDEAIRRIGNNVRFDRKKVVEAMRRKQSARGC